MENAMRSRRSARIERENPRRTVDISDEDDEKESPRTSSRKRESAPARRVTKSTRISAASSRPEYVEASSDDEFAKQNFVIKDDSDSEHSEDNAASSLESGDEGGVDGDIEYRIQHLLGWRKQCASDWRAISEKINTRELNRGSVLKQPESEYMSDSPALIEKYLVKWEHASYLHVSWETYHDLLELVGPSIKTHIKRLFQREQGEVAPLFEDLSSGEYFPPEYLQVERVIDIEDDSVEPLEVAYDDAVLPSLSPSMENSAILSSDGSSEELEDSGGEDAASSQTHSKTRQRQRLRQRGQPPSNVLHGEDCWLTIKWAGLQYSDHSVESVKDLVSLGIDYEQFLRDFFKREQCPIVAKRDSSRSLEGCLSVLDTSEPPVFRGRQLKDYQWQGVKWLLFNWGQRRNSILADEMGLGKTMQSAALLQLLKTHKAIRGPFLIVAPLSTVVNWYREVTTWTDLDAVIYHGSSQDRQLIRDFEFSFLKRSKTDGSKIEVVITSPETCMTTDGPNSNRKALSKISWELMIIDEAHRLKNHDSKISTVLREEYSYKNCVLLTGTPLQNSISELWTLLHFVDRDEFADREGFISEFGDLKTSSQLEGLHDRLKPYLLRREKENVEKEVPPKEELLVEVELTIPQKQYYRAIYEQNTQFLFRGGGKDGPRLSNLAMEVRKCCNHPFLIKGARAALADHFVADSSQEVLIKASGKMMLLDKLLPKLRSDGHRVLIFSQFRIMLDILEDFLTYRGFSYERVDGAVTGKKRQSAIDRYSAPGAQTFVMLLSTRAGGVGINLTSADTVIIYDSDWNPQNDLQAQARAHRIGQAKTVKVYRLLTRKSYEMVMFKTASMKLGLDYAVMHNLNIAASVERPAEEAVPTKKRGKGEQASKADDATTGLEHASSLSKKELEHLLKNGAYDIFREDADGRGDEESERFYEDDIDIILQRSAVVMHDSTGKSAISKVSSSFAKASFVSSNPQEASNNIDLDDPDFWTKVVGMASGAGKEESGRKRKCAMGVGSYKEPGLSLKASDLEEQGSSSKRRSSTTPEDEGILIKAELSDENLQRLSIALAARGFGNWTLIQSDSKLKWSEVDICRASRFLLLQLVLWSAIQPSSAAALELAEVCDDTIVKDYDVSVIESLLRRHRGCRLAVLSLVREVQRCSKFSLEELLSLEEPEEFGFLSDVTVVESDADSDFGIEEKICSKFQWSELISTAVRGEEQQSDEAIMQEILQYVIRASQLLPTDFSAVTVGKSSRIRTNAKSKLQQIEELFDLKLISKCHGTPAMPLLDSGDALALQNELSSFSPLLAFLASKEELQVGLYKEKQWNWNAIHDTALILAISQVGYPDSKKRLSTIAETFSIELNKMCTTSEEISLENEIQDLLSDSKFVTKRMKDLLALLRCLPEQVKKTAAPNDQAAIAKANKLFSKNLMKAMLNIGRPRPQETIGSTEPEVLVSATEDAMSIETLTISLDDMLDEMMLEKSEENRANVDSGVAALVSAYEDWSGTQDNTSANSSDDATSKSIQTGLLTGVPFKQLDACFERDYILHQIRVILSEARLDDFVELRSIIKRGCKGAGPSCPKPRRDPSLPVWWTPFHDVQLMRLVATDALPPSRRQLTDLPSRDPAVVGSCWHAILQSPAVSTAMQGFSMPPSSGIKWVTSITPKVAEKRLSAILPVIAAAYATKIPQLSSEVYRSKQKPASSLEQNKVLYGARPSWVTSLMATKPAAVPSDHASSGAGASPIDVDAVVSEPILDTEEGNKDLAEEIEVVEDAMLVEDVPDRAVPSNPVEIKPNDATSQTIDVPVLQTNHIACDPIIFVVDDAAERSDESQCTKVIEAEKDVSATKVQAKPTKSSKSSSKPPKASPPTSQSPSILQFFKKK